MTNLPKATAASTEDFLAGAGPQLADLCTACGACFRACPFPSHLGLDAADASVVTDGLRKLARGEAGPEATVAWVGACGKSGQCVTACPERHRGLDAMLLVRIARQHAINRTQQLKAKHDPTAFPRVKTFARLQLTDEEIKRWL
ncbi:MAG: 4Fe-4S binding protein [Hyphomicrobiaceae bacterium]